MPKRLLNSLFTGALVLAAFQLVSAVETTLPQEFTSLIEAGHPLLRYEEAGISPLGRSPVVDVVLSDPFYLPTYGRLVSSKIRETTKSVSLRNLYTTILIAGGVPILGSKNEPSSAQRTTTPQVFIDNFSKELGTEIYSLWKHFLMIYREAEITLAPLSQEEKQWLKENYESFFFGAEDNDAYDFFTTNSSMPLKFFELAAKVDLAKLANLCVQLSQIVDDVYTKKEEFTHLAQEKTFKWEEQGRSLIISGESNSLQNESADFFIALGSHNTYKNNAGGTEGLRAAALFIDLQGSNTFIGDRFVQGCGFLGVGVLANFGGDNTYEANACAQGAGFIGSGALMDLGSHNHYEINFFGQSCAVFGTSLLWDKGKDSVFLAHDGMAQAASSTLGVAFLVENGGNSTFISGSSKEGGFRSSGIGQGASIGVRFDPWVKNPSFYGGVSFLYASKGHNKFQTPWYGQGSAYFLGAGILVVEGGDNEFIADVDSQGQGLHLAAGLLLSEGGGNRFSGGWGSLGVAGDRSTGIFINSGGNNFFQGTVQSIGTSRKPKALGIFIDLDGHNTYQFGSLSNANIQRPMTPEEWPMAFFLEFGSQNHYPENVDELKRGPESKWGIDGHSIGIDHQANMNLPFLLSKFPAKPRINFTFDPFANLSANTAFRPLQETQTEHQAALLVNKIPKANYEERRQIYESLDLYRFTHPKAKIDVAILLQNPAALAEDAFNYAALWALLDQDSSAVDKVNKALEDGTLSSAYSRRMALKYLGKLGGQKFVPTFAKVMNTDLAEENRVLAVSYLTKSASPSTLDLLKPALQSPSERIRYAAAKGLQDHPSQDVLTFIFPLFKDESFYVRRAAAMTAISLREKKGIPILLETLQYESLDTGENYGDNLYNALSKYVGVNFGVNKQAWLEWWQEVKDTFEFPVLAPACSAYY